MRIGLLIGDIEAAHTHIKYASPYQMYPTPLTADAWAWSAMYSIIFSVWFVLLALFAIVKTILPNPLL